MLRVTFYPMLFGFGYVEEAGKEGGREVGKEVRREEGLSDRDVLSKSREPHKRDTMSSMYIHTKF